MTDELERLRQQVFSMRTVGGSTEALAAFDAAVRRDERASMPCYGCEVNICLTCAARAERDGGAE